jgi:hypothetical protein
VVLVDGNPSPELVVSLVAPIISGAIQATKRASCPAQMVSSVKQRSAIRAIKIRIDLVHGPRQRFASLGECVHPPLRFELKKPHAWMIWFADLAIKDCPNRPVTEAGAPRRSI